MGYVGNCTFVIFCSGASAHVSDASSGNSVAGFDLHDGGRQTHEFSSGPGLYRVTVRPGNDTARWSVFVEDYF